MPSEKEIHPAVEAVVETLWDEVKMPYDVTAIDLADIISETLAPFLSAAEKERNGSKLPAAQKGREGETCFDLTCSEVATHKAPIDGHGWCLYCAEHAEGLTGARRLSREGDVIEKLREWARDCDEKWDRAFNRGMDGATVGVAKGVLRGLTRFLNDLQEQSTPKEEA